MPLTDINFKQITWLVLDVDGVLTNGTVMLHPDGSESKQFNLQDGHGIKMFKRAGLGVALLSGRESAATQRRADQLQIEHVFEGCTAKLPVLEEFIHAQGITPEQVAYVGDDVLDLPIVRRVGFGVAVANAVNELKHYADYVTERAGGEGAVREVIELILKRSDRWPALMERYLA